MPWPFVPPDPDFPAPIMASISNPYSATGIKLTGMVPYSEQTNTRFRVGGDHAGVWVPYDVGSGYKYSGVLIGELGSQSTATLKAEWLQNGGSTKSTTLTLSQTNTWAGSISLVSMGTANGKRVFTVKGEAPTTGSHHIVVAPYAYEMPAFSSQAAYGDAGGWTSLSGSDKVDVEVTVSAVTQYAIFVGTGFPSQLEVISEVWLYTV